MITVKYFGQSRPDQAAPISVWNMPDVPPAGQMGKINMANGKPMESSFQQAMPNSKQHDEGLVALHGADTPDYLANKLSQLGSIKPFGSTILLEGEEDATNYNRPLTIYGRDRNGTKRWHSLFEWEHLAGARDRSMAVATGSESNTWGPDEPYSAADDQHGEFENFNNGQFVNIELEQVTRVRIVPQGDKFGLYAFTRILRFSPVGRLIYVSPEQRKLICDVEECSDGSGDLEV